jgi:hypothetical protein
MFGIASKIIEDMFKELKQREDRATRDLLVKLTPSGTNIGDHASNLNQLPSTLLDQLFNSFTQSWQGMGFASQADAQSFLEGSGQLSMSTELSLKYCMHGAGPGTGMATAFAEYGLNNIPGRIAP